MSIISLHDIDRAALFYLTKNECVEVLSAQEAFLYANQYLLPCDEEVDDLGRNRTDRAFLRLCDLAYVYDSMSNVPNSEFKSLSCKKVGDNYHVRLVLSNETLEMELFDMVELLQQRMP